MLPIMRNGLNGPFHESHSFRSAAFSASLAAFATELETAADWATRRGDERKTAANRTEIDICRITIMRSLAARDYRRRKIRVNHRIFTANHCSRHQLIADEGQSSAVRRPRGNVEGSLA